MPIPAPARPIPAPAARAVPTVPAEPAPAAPATADSTWGDSEAPLKPLREILLGRSYETWMLDVVWKLNFLQFQDVECEICGNDWK